MNTVDSFFVSEGLEDLFDVKVKASVLINSTECSFRSYSSKGRVLKFEVQNLNPFEILEKSSSLNAVIKFSSGIDRKVNYSNWSYKIEQSSFGFIITVGDNNEQE